MKTGAKQLRNMIYNILENSDAVSGVTLKNSPNSSTLLLDRADGKGRMTFHTPVSYTHLDVYKRQVLSNPLYP